MTVERTETPAQQAKMAIDGLHTFSPQGLSIASASVGGLSDAGRAHAEQLITDINSTGAAFLSIAKSAIPASLVAAVATAVASADPGLAGIAIGTAAMGGAVTAFTGGGKPSKDSPSRG